MRELWRSGYLDSINLDNDGYFTEDTTVSDQKFEYGRRAKDIWNLLFGIGYPANSTFVQNGVLFYKLAEKDAIVASFGQDGPSTVFFFSTNYDNDNVYKVWERLTNG